MEDGITLDDLTYYLEQNWNMDEYWMNPHFNPRAADEPENRLRQSIGRRKVR